MKTAKAIIKNSAWLISGEILGKIVIFFLIIIVARKVGVANFGKYNLALSFVMIFSVISDLGLNIFLFREIARNRDLLSKYVSNVFAMRVALSILFFGIVLIFAKIFNYSSDMEKLIYLFAGWACFTNLTYVFRTGFRAMEIMKWDAVVNILDNVLRLMIVAIAINLGLNIWGVGKAYLTAAFIAFCVSMIIFMRYFAKLGFRLDFSLWRIALKEMRFLALVAILIPLFGRFDAIVLSYFNGNEAVGLYSASLKLVWMLIFIPSFITQSAFPRLSQYAFQDKNRFKSLISYLLKSNFILTFFISILICLLAHRIILLVYGIKYLASVRVLQILIWCFPLHGLNGVFIYGLNAKNRQKINAIFIGSAILFNILLAIMFAPKFNYIGVSFATLMSLFFLFILLITYYVKNDYLRLKELKFTHRDFNIIREAFSWKITS